MPGPKKNGATAAGKHQVSEEEANLRQWRKELDWFERSVSSLVARPELHNKFIAVKGGKILDQDRDEIKLVKRITKKYPRQVIFIGRIPPDNTVYELPSPEIIREV